MLFSFCSIYFGIVVLPNLTRLAITFQEDFRHFDIAKSVFKNIKNAPVLKILDLTTIQIDLNNMEDLHGGAPNLETLQLHDVRLRNIPTRDMPITRDGKSLLNRARAPFVEGIAGELKTFYLFLINSGIQFDNMMIGETFKRWCIYAGQRYHNLNSFYVSHEELIDSPISMISAFEKPVVYALSNMPNITICGMAFTPLTMNILKAMDSNHAKLTDLHVTAENPNVDMEPQLKNLKLSQKRRNIRNLSISSAEEGFTNYVFNRPLASIDCQFSSLVKLDDILSDYSHHTVLLDIIHNAPPTVSTLKFSSINFVCASRNQSFPKSQLKKLGITLRLEEDANLDDWNNRLETIIHVCLNLETIKLECEEFMCDIAGALYLNFRGLENLKNINLQLYGFEYYKMNQADKQGRLWIDYNNTLETPPSGESCHINLSWVGQPSVELKRLEIDDVGFE